MLGKLESLEKRMDNQLSSIQEALNQRAQVLANDPIMQNPKASIIEITKFIHRIPNSPMSIQDQQKSQEINIYLPVTRRDKLIKQLQQARPDERKDLIKNALEYRSCL